MSSDEVKRIERLLSDFAWFADQGDAVGLSGLFVPEGVLCVGGQEMAGQPIIAADCQKRFATPDRKTRHVWTNLRVESMTGNMAKTTAVQLTYETLGADKPTRLRVNDVFDELRKDAQGEWQFVRRHIKCEMALALTGQ